MSRAQVGRRGHERQRAVALRRNSTSLSPGAEATSTRRRRALLPPRRKSPNHHVALVAGGERRRVARLAVALKPRGRS